MKVDLLPHQIDAVYGYVLKLAQIRFFNRNNYIINRIHPKNYK